MKLNLQCRFSRNLPHVNPRASLVGVAILISSMFFFSRGGLLVAPLGAESPTQPPPSSAAGKAFGQPAPSYQQGDKLFLWEIVKPKQKAYLLGSIHILPPSAFPLDAKYNQAFEKSDAIAVEVDMSGTKGKIAQRAMLRMGKLPKGQSLKDVVSADVYAKFKKKCQAMNIPPEPLMVMKPWWIALALPMVEIQTSGKVFGEGVDVHYLRRAKIQGKPIVELETYASQLGMFNNLSMEEQEALLLNSLAFEKGGNLKHFEELVQIWLSGDRVKMEVKMSDFAKNQPKLKNLKKKMFTDRNHQMTKRIEKLMASGKTHLIIVGAGHMAGPDGIVHLLRLKGYRVRQASR